MTKKADGWGDMHWLNPPPAWQVNEDASLSATSGDKTDFWQRTFYGFQRDDGHALLAAADDDFTAEVTVDANFTELYDQCGLLLRVSPERWVKFGVEFTDGETHMSCVVTDGTSDWSAAPVRLNGPFSLRATRLGDAVMCQYRTNVADDASVEPWRLARLLPFGGVVTSVRAGPYLCSPERAGFSAIFSEFEISAPKQTQLHA